MSTQLETLKKRQDVAYEDKWNVEALYPSFTSWEEDFNKYNKNTSSWKKLASFKGRLEEGAETFQEALELKLSLERALEKLYVYAHLRHDEEITDDINKNAYERIASLFSDFHKEIAWFEPELLSLSNELQEKYLASCPSFRFYLQKILRFAPHSLSADKEEMLAMAAKPFRSISKAFSALNNADIKFDKILDKDHKEYTLSHGLYQLYLRSHDRVLRKNAFVAMHKKFSELENTMAELIFGQIEKHIFHARVRNFPSALQSALFPHNISEDVYTTLIKTVKKGLPLLHRYIGMRKKALKLSEIHLYDVYVPLVKEINISMSYQEAEQATIDSVLPLGEEYQSLLRKGLKQEKWVDRFENQNKRSGAYSSGCYDSSPYILMNFRGTLRDVFTLAHEAGHSMHSLLSFRNQKYHDASYPIFVAEVASTFNEELLMHHLLKKTTSKEERLFLLNEKIEDIRATFFRQTMFAEFELTLHKLVEEGIPLTPHLIKEKYYALNKEYFGPDIVIDEDIAIEWARIPHFYYNFYVYQYATGISCALALSEKVIKQEKGSADNYLNFLKKGGSQFPIDLLKIAGVDITTPAPIEGLLKKFENLLTEFETLQAQ